MRHRDLQTFSLFFACHAMEVVEQNTHDITEFSYIFALEGAVYYTFQQRHGHFQVSTYLRNDLIPTIASL